MKESIYYKQLDDAYTELVEVVDDDDAPIMVMPVETVHTQPLRHRVVLTLLYDTAGRVYLQRRAHTKKLYPGRWDLSSTGHVLAGESREHAALRELNEELRVFPGKVLPVLHIPASTETEYASITLFSARLGGDMPTPNPQEVSDGVFMDSEELETMMQHFKELLTPAVVWAMANNLIFARTSETEPQTP